MPATFDKKTKEASYVFEETQVTHVETVELVHPTAGRAIVRVKDEAMYRSRGYVGLDEQAAAEAAAAAAVAAATPAKK